MLILGRHLPAAVGWLMSMGWPGLVALSLWGGHTAQLGHCHRGNGAEQHLGVLLWFWGAASMPWYQPSFCAESGWGINESLSVQMSSLILIALSSLFPFMDTPGGVGG